MILNNPFKKSVEKTTTTDPVVAVVSEEAPKSVVCEGRYITLPHPTKEFKEIKSFLKKYNLPKVTESHYANVISKLGLPNGGKFAYERLPLLRAALRS